MFKKNHEEKPHAEKSHEKEPSLDPKDARIKKLEDCLNYLKEFAVQGNINHVKTIESALNS